MTLALPSNQNIFQLLRLKWYLAMQISKSSIKLSILPQQIHEDYLNKECIFLTIYPQEFMVSSKKLSFSVYMITGDLV